MVVIDNSDAEQITIELEEVVQWVKSNVKHILIEEMEGKEKQPIELNKKSQNLYQLYKDTINEFKMIDKHFQELVKPENSHEEKFIIEEFNKISTLADLRYQIKNAKALEFYEIYKDKIEQKIAYCKNEMTIFDINILNQEIQGIIYDHDANSINIRKQRAQAIIKIEQEKNRLQQEENNKKKIEKNQKIQEEKQKKIDSITQQINNITIKRDWLLRERDKISNHLNRMIFINKEIGRLNGNVGINTKKINVLPEIISLQKEWFRVSDERIQAFKEKIDYHWEIAQIYRNKMNVIDWKFQKYSELLWNLIVLNSCPSDNNIQRYEKYCQDTINQDSLSIKKYEEEKSQITRDLNSANQITIENLNKEINELFTQIQKFTNEKNAI